MIYLNKILSSAVMFLLINSALTANAQEYKVSGVSATGNNSDVIDYDIPNNLSPGQSYAVTITMVNNGITKWTRGDDFSLKLYNDVDNNLPYDVWGTNRVEIPNDVYPSDKMTFSFKIYAPQTKGSYIMKWAMSKNYEFFGEYTNNVINVGGDNITQVSQYDGDNSEFVSLSIPEKMAAGEKYKVRVTMKNTGTSVWLPGSLDGYKIAPVTETSDIIYPEWNTNAVYLSNSIDPGQTSDIEFYVTAPLNPGIYGMQWMMKKGDNYFGQKTNRAGVNVYQNNNGKVDPGTFNSGFMEQSVPISMSFNEFQDVSLTFSNTGSTTWIKGNEQLVMIDAKNSLVTINQWNVGYIQLPNNVEPGSLVTFNFKVKPTDQGWQYFQCSMMKEDGTLFGSPSKSVEVIISK